MTFHDSLVALMIGYLLFLCSLFEEAFETWKKVECKKRYIGFGLGLL